MKTKIASLLRAALAEDIGSGDLTSKLLIPKDAKAKAQIVAKQSGVFCGGPILRALFRIGDPKVKVKIQFKEGRKFKKGQTAIRLQGNLRSILKIERTALNLLSHLSGISTETHVLVQKVKGKRVKIYDTRKTLPLWRELQKYAVKVGGGYNHRMGLYDQVFVKENHRRYGIKKLKRARGFVMEVRNHRELREALSLNPKVILFDNFKPKALKRAVQWVRSQGAKVRLEASGGIHKKNIVQYANTGIDQFSLGSLTHTVKPIDFTLLVMGPKKGDRS